MSDERPTFGSLFAGIGGIDLGLERAGWECRFQVEWDPFCQRVLAKHWPDVPRYGDITAVDWSGVERVDLLAGGFPCQPVSFAGRRAIVDDDRWLWPEFARAIRALRPRLVLVENVPGLLVGGGMDAVLGGLAELGYDTEWESIPAAAVGAPHLRYRVWIVAYRQADAPRPDANGSGPHRTGVVQLRDAELRDEQVGVAGQVGAVLADTGRGSVRVDSRRGQAHGEGGAAQGQEDQRERSGHPAGGRGTALADSDDAGLQGLQGLASAALPERQGATGHGRPSGSLEDAAGGRRERRRTEAGSPQGGWSFGLPARSDEGSGTDWWLVEPDVGRVAHGVPARVDRLRSLGNAVVPQVVEYIGRRILEAEGLT